MSALYLSSEPEVLPSTGLYKVPMMVPLAEAATHSQRCADCPQPSGAEQKADACMFVFGTYILLPQHTTSSSVCFERTGRRVCRRKEAKERSFV